MGKKELGAWLAGSYADVTRDAPRISEAPWSAASVPPSSVPRSSRDLVAARSSRDLVAPRSSREIAPYAVSRLMQETHDEVIAVLAELAEPDGGVGFIYGAVDTLVEHTYDARPGAEGVASWVPRAPSRMRLADRVLSLIAVDYLSRPEDYESRLFICSRCTLVGFDAAARARGLCRVHAASGVRFRSEIPPVPAEAPPGGAREAS